jgi:DnaJ-class molecular chaperone
VSGADPYALLGLGRDASAKDIQKAYRGLAKKHHPDLNPGDSEAERQFKAVTAAYEILKDPDKRARFDRGEIDASGAEQPQQPQQRYYRDFAEAAAGGGRNPYASDAGFADLADEDDILAQLFGRGGRFAADRRGADVRYRLAVDFLDAVNGATPRLTLPDGTVLDVTIPPGTRDGQTLRLRGKGRPGAGDGEPGSALIDIEVRPHRLFRREGDDIHLTLPITLGEAVLGGRVTVPTPSGAVAMTVPKGANTGRVLRLRGKGVVKPDGSRGDAYVRLEVMLPEAPDPALEKLVADWRPAAAYEPRRNLEVLP